MNNCEPKTPSAAAKEVTLTQFIRVVDGDTIEVQPMAKGEPTREPNFMVHMLGVEAPGASDCGGDEAIANLTRLFIPNEYVDVTFESTLQNLTDEDGNTLAYVVTGNGVRQDVGARMVSEGFASAVYPEGQTAPEKFKQYVADSKIAMDQKKGIWTSCPAV